jgi:hypothetical protein
MRIFKNKVFNKWARNEGLTAGNLKAIAAKMADGDTSGSLGKKVFKKRVALDGRGKRGSTRTLIAYESDGNVFFIYGFAKNKRATISPIELIALQKLAGEYLAYTDKELNKAVDEKVLIEIKVKDS